MEIDEKPINTEHLKTLLELGFEEQNIVKALRITDNLEQASQIALKLAD